MSRRKPARLDQDPLFPALKKAYVAWVEAKSVAEHLDRENKHLWKFAIRDADGDRIEIDPVALASASDAADNALVDYHYFLKRVRDGRKQTITTIERELRRGRS
jgi:hypothetical protein